MPCSSSDLDVMPLLNKLIRATFVCVCAPAQHRVCLMSQCIRLHMKHQVQNYGEKDFKHEGLADLMIPLMLGQPLQVVDMVIKLVEIF